MVRFDQIYMAKSKEITMTTKHEYGSVEFFTEMFDDILADVEADKPEIGNNIITAFKLAIAGWRDYHKKQAEEYNRLYFEKDWLH